ncbi:MAG TPA: PQQ-binding-like beta-propeller repeat protein [Streptosporangiaceae bacterium]|nr:PQQ-binding-like beta-propeller repeat protein [Streptosporangiaceae bacterium]
MMRAYGHSRRSRGYRLAAPLVTAALAVATCTLPGESAALGSVVSAASARSLYAYAAGAARSPRSCPKTAQRGRECSLTQALSLVKPGGSVLLATGGKAGAYYGNFVIGTRHTSAGKPVTIRPAPGAGGPVINGDAAGKVRCPTTTCHGPVLTVRARVVANVRSVTITGGRNASRHGGGGIDDMGAVNLTGVTITNCSAEVGGGVVVAKGARLAVNHSAFTGDRSDFFGGAIDNGSVIAQVAGSGRLVVTDSVFTRDHSQRGGAIDNGNGGTGTATIARSTFSRDSASDHGGAIDNADSGHGTLTVTGSTFSGDSAKFGGAIDNADSDGVGTLTVTSSTFSADSAVHGGAIDNGERGNGTVTVRTSTFHADKASDQGSVFDTGDAGGAGTVVILDSTIDNNLGKSAISRLSGSVQMAGSILAGSKASCSRAITDAGYNLTDNTRSNCGFSLGNTDLVGVHPNLRPLARAGGPTATMAPASASPALEQIPNPAVAQIDPGNHSVRLCPIPDQRGDKSAEAVGCAIGAVDPASRVPVVTTLGSSIGPANGGRTVVIHGGNFAARATVSFGAVKSPHVTVVSATKITATIPALPSSSSSQTVTVTVKNPSGPVSRYRAAAIYTYYTPDWSAYLGGASHSSYNPAATSISSASMANLRPIWQWLPPPTLPSSDAGGTTTDDASPIAYKGVIYVGLEDGYMEAINEKTGQQVWPNPVFLGVELGNTCGSAGFGIISTATVATDPVTGKPVVYINAPDGHLYALDAATGDVLWKSVVGIPSTSIDNFYAWGSPTVANGKVYIGIASNCDVPLVKAGVLSFNQHTGNKIAYWDSLPPSVVGASVWGSVVVLPNGDVAATTGNAQNDNNIPDSESINVLDGNTLKLLGTWEAPQKQAFGDSDFGASPTVFTAYPDGVATTMVGACNKDGIYYALRANDMSAGPLWTRKMGIPTSGELSNECDAAAIWNGKYLIEGGGSQATINGATYDGSVQALNPTTGKPIWQTGLDGWIVGSPSEDGAGVVAAPVLFSPFDAGHGPTGVYLLSAATGKILKFISTDPQGLFAQPVWDGTDLLIGDDSAALPLTAYAVTKSTQTAPLGVSPGDVSKNTTVTLMLTATGGAGFTSPPNVIISGSQVVVQSVQVDSSTTLEVTVKVLNDAESGAALDVTATLPNLISYSCTQCLAIN